MTVSLRPLRRGEESALGRSMVYAFFDDPVLRMMVPDETRRINKGTWIMEKMIGYCARYGEVYTDDALSGGSAWLTPGNTEITLMRTIVSGLWQFPFRVGFRNMGRMNRMDAAMKKLHKRIAPGEHWYLQILGTHPNSQGTGLGTAAIEIGAAKARAARLPIYLETMTQVNVDYYEKRGFEVAEKLEVDPELTIWAMLRQPV